MTCATLRTVAGLCLFAAAFLAGGAARGEEDDPRHPFAGLEYRLLGPAAGGRVSRVAGVPGDPLTYWAATSAGGVWKSSDGGDTWKPVFDDQPASSIGAIAVAPSDPNVVYVGSGEANIRGNVAAGNGIYLSRDGGKSWTHVWKQVGQIGTLVVHPADPDVAYAAVLGNPFASNPERGVYRTRDGGATWERVLFRDADTGASDVELDPANPRTVFAGLWQARRRPWELVSGGPGSGLWVSRDGGDTWSELRGQGLPEGVWGKVGVRVAPADPRRVYALIEAEAGGLFRSDDGGESWERVTANRGLRQRAWYYTTLTVDPLRADVVWFPQVNLLKTIDGGRSVRSVKGAGWDYHDLWIDPRDPRRVINGSDAGVAVSRDGGESWSAPPLPISQFYHVATDSRRPYRVLGSIQDFGTASGPSNSLHEGGVYLSDWHDVGGGEAGHVAADPDDPDVVWAGEYLGVVTRYDHRTRQARNVSAYPENGSGHGAGDLRYRFQWTAPILVSAHDPATVYHAANVLFRTRDRGQSWEIVSPDLTRDDASKQRWSGGPITGDNTGVEFYCTIFALAESPLDPAVLWAGSDDGLVHVTRDGGRTWSNVTPSGLPEWGTVATIEASRWAAGTAYAVVDAHRLGDFRPYLWRTTDYGASWTSLAGGLAGDVYLHVLREDTRRRGMLFLGTERGVAYSLDDGATWKDLRLNLPTAAVHDLRVHGDDLVVGTMGRSIWILDNLRPLRTTTSEVLAAPLHLYPPPPAVRWGYARVLGSEAGAGKNPPRGAIVDYYLKEEPAEPEAVRLEVFDAGGRLVRTLRGVPEPLPIGPEHPDWPAGEEVKAALTVARGVNRAVWDLRWDGAGYLPAGMIDWGDPGSGPLALPGEYRLRLTAGEHSAESTVAVEPDPRSAVPAADLEAQLGFALELRAQIRRVIALVEEARSLRRQLLAREEALARLAGGDADPRLEALAALGRGMRERLDALESRLHNPRAEVSYDVLAQPGGAQLYSRLSPLWSFALDGEGAPTEGMREVAAGQTLEIDAHAAALAALVAGDLARFEELAREAGVPQVVAGAAR